MGVFTVGRQVALEIDMPGWWLANAAIDMDFRRGLYYDSSTANPRAATDFLSCTRASVGYAKTSSGTLTSFASNALRITDLGLLVEDARTNSLVRSAEFSNAVWIAGFITVNADVAVAPDGTTTADSLIPGVGNNEHNVYAPCNNASGVYTWSVYMKPAGYNFGSIDAIDAAGNRYCVVYNLITGAATANSTQGTPAAATTFFEILGTGWVRLGLSLASGGTAYIQCGPCDTGTPTFGGSNNPTFVGDGSSGAYIWGAQVEAGSFPSSYIPTTSAAATRAAENITTSSSLQTAINAATGSLVAQVDNGSAASVAANVVDSNGTNLLGFDASNHALASMIGALATVNTANRTTQDKLGLAWNASGRSLFLNGGTVATDASAQTPSATQHVGSTGTANFIYAYVERLSAFTAKLADATLQGFTV